MYQEYKVNVDTVCTQICQKRKFSILKHVRLKSAYWY